MKTALNNCVFLWHNSEMSSSIILLDELQRRVNHSINPATFEIVHPKEIRSILQYLESSEANLLDRVGRFTIAYIQPLGKLLNQIGRKAKGKYPKIAKRLRNIIKEWRCYVSIMSDELYQAKKIMYHYQPPVLEEDAMTNSWEGMQPNNQTEKLISFIYQSFIPRVIHREAVRSCKRKFQGKLDSAKRRKLFARHNTSRLKWRLLQERQSNQRLRKHLAQLASKNQKERVLAAQERRFAE